MASKVDPAKLAAAAQNLEGGNVADPEVLQDLLEDMASVIDDNADGLDGAVKKSGDMMTGPLTLERTNDSVFVNFDVKGTGFRTYVRALKNGVEQNGSRFGYDTNTQQWGVYNLETLIGNLWHAGNLPVESGNWTVTIEGLTTPGSPSYYYRAGYYYRIGKLVYVFFVAALTDKGGVAGQVRVRGLPFPVASTSPAFSFQGLSIARVVSVNFPANAVDFMASFVQGGSDIFFQFALSNGGDAVAVDDTHIGNFFEVRASGVYLTV
jgi:hypothetical protein